MSKLANRINAALAVHDVIKNAQLGQTPLTTESVVKAVSPMIEHATNNEPWYQSRVTWGAIAAIVVPVLGAIGVGADIISAEELTVWGMAVGSAAGGVLTIYGRWAAQRPIGR